MVGGSRHLMGLQLPGAGQPRFGKHTPAYQDQDRCPFGCTRNNGLADDNGLCEHYVGVALAGQDVFHGLRQRDLFDGEKPCNEYTYLDGNVRFPILPDDVLVKITKDARVYRQGGRRTLNFNDPYSLKNDPKVVDSPKPRAIKPKRKRKTRKVERPSVAKELSEAGVS